MATYSPSKITKDGNTYNFTDANAVPRSGGAVITGTDISRNVDNSYLIINGGTTMAGGSISAHGKNEVNLPGGCLLHADDGTKDTNYIFYPNGSATFGTEFRFTASSSFEIGSLSGYYMLLRYDGVIWSNSDHIIPLNNITMNLGVAGNAWKDCFLFNAPVVVSDARAKTQIQNIDDKLLDAWENVEIKTYKMVSSVEKKGEKARYHTGYLAQDIQGECEKQGVDASDYGLFCYDEWDEQEEVSEEIETEKDGKKVKEKRVIQPKREKGNTYALRYEEAFAVECAYLRKKNKELQAQLDKVIARLDKLEGVQTK